MAKTNVKYTYLSVVTIIIGFVSAVGSAISIINIIPTVSAEEYLPNCENIERYERWVTTPTIVSSPVNITEDEIASYVVPDQAERCKAEFNLNGHTVTEAYQNRSETRSSLRVGSNVVAIVNGDGGTFAVGSPEDAPNSHTYPAIGRTPASGILVYSGGELVIKDMTVEAKGDTIYIKDSAKAEVNNVIVSESLWNNGGELIVNGGDYPIISAKSGGQTTINDGVFRNIKVESGSDIIINGGVILDSDDNPGGTIRSLEKLPENYGYVDPISSTVPTTNDITINGGNFENLTIETPLTINGGTFTNSSFESKTEVTSGTFTNTDFNGETSITDGVFTSSTFSDDTVITDGVFIGNTISEDATITGGTFDTIPEPENISSDRKVIENDNGTYSVVDESTPGEEPIKVCEAKLYTDADTYTTSNTAININEDTTMSIVVTDQDENCRLVVNINNGSTLTSVENMEAIIVGDNVGLKVNGNNGEVKQNDNNTDDNISTIKISDGATANIKDVTVSTNNTDGANISNSGVTTLNNVTADDNIKNENGKLTVVDSEIKNIESTDSSTVIIEGSEIESISTSNNSTVEVVNGEIKNISAEDNSSVQISDGKVESIEASGDSNINITGGDFTNSTISSDSNDANNVVIDGGTFNGATLDSPVTISGGTFANANISNEAVISGGIFDTPPDEENIPEGAEVVRNEDGTFSIVSKDTSNSTATKTSPVKDDTVKVPETGVISSENSMSRQAEVTTIVAAEAILLVICGHILHHINCKKKINFKNRNS